MIGLKGQTILVHFIFIFTLYLLSELPMTDRHGYQNFKNLFVHRILGEVETKIDLIHKL